MKSLETTIRIYKGLIDKVIKHFEEESDIARNRTLYGSKKERIEAFGRAQAHQFDATYLRKLTGR